jgi:hypothetical protein
MHSTPAKLFSLLIQNHDRYRAAITYIRFWWRVLELAKSSQTADPETQD